MAVHASEPSEAERVPTVSLAYLRAIFADSLISLTQATDTTNIRLVFAAVKETILQNALKDSGIL